jgi:hypothetical protein
MAQRRGVWSRMSPEVTLGEHFDDNGNPLPEVDGESVYARGTAPAPLPSAPEADQKLNNKVAGLLLDMEHDDEGARRNKSRGASGSWGDVPEKVKAKVKAVAKPVAEETETSKPITSGIDSIMEAYRSGKLDKFLAKKGEAKKADETKGTGGAGEAGKAKRRTEELGSFQPDTQEDNSKNYRSILQGAYVATGNAKDFDAGAWDRRAQEFENRKREKGEAYDREYRRAHDADTADERMEEKAEQRRWRAEESDKARAAAILAAREKAQDAAERAAADRALRAEIARGNMALRAALMQHSVDKEFERNVQRAGKDLEGISRMRPDIDTLKAQLAKHDNGEGMDGFGLWDSIKPGVLDSNEDIDVRQGAMRNLAKIILENSGKVANEAEVQRTLDGYGLGRFKTEEQSAHGIQALIRDAEMSASTRSGKYQPEVLEAVEERSGGVYSALRPDGSEVKPSRMAGPQSPGQEWQARTIQGKPVWFNPKTNEAMKR